MSGTAGTGRGWVTCVSHPAVRAETSCGRCARVFCDACLVTLLGRRLCGPCRDADLERLSGERAGDPIPSRLQTLAICSIFAVVVPPLSFALAVGALIGGALYAQRLTGGAEDPARFKVVSALVLSLVVTAGWLVLYLGFMASMFLGRL
jgi:hypothetical protein